MGNQESVTSETSLYSYFNGLSVLLENTLQSLNKGGGSKEIENKLPDAFSEMAFLGAAQACISQASERIQKQINNNLSIINKSNATFEQAFKKEEDAIADFVKSKNTGNYSSVYGYQQKNTASAGQAQKNSGKSASSETVTVSERETARGCKPDVEKMKLILSSLTEKLKNSTDVEKVGIHKIIPDVIVIVEEIRKTFEVENISG